jgi:hypothetical protein
MAEEIQVPAVESICNLKERNRLHDIDGGFIGKDEAPELRERFLFAKVILSLKLKEG